MRDMSCHLHAEACDCKAYLIAMGENDRLLEADLEREEAKTVIAQNVAAGDNKSSARIGAANSNPGLISKTTGGSQVTETDSIIPSQAQSAPANPNSRIKWAHPSLSKILDPVEILDIRARSCSRAEDPAFWILTIAAAHLNGYNLDDGQGSTVQAWLRRQSIDAPPFDSDEVAG